MGYGATFGILRGGGMAPCPPPKSAYEGSIAALTTAQNPWKHSDTLMSAVYVARICQTGVFLAWSDGW